LNSAGNEEELKQASVDLNNSDYYLCDITKDSEVKDMINNFLSKHGHIDGLVNNAGGGGWASIADPDSEWQKSFDLDILGAVHLCRYVLPHMKEQKTGSVVNICSLWGVPGTAKASIASYSVSKAAIHKLTENLASEFAPEIRVNGVAPGWTKTKMILDDFDEDGIKFMESNVLLKRLAEPEEIGSVVTFLLSEASSYITGQTISADGGYLLNRQNIDR
jgi:NAD(P)-dependent dehydrogenase (short-subunit alcohol dehydrogenase family)